MVDDRKLDLVFPPVEMFFLIYIYLAFPELTI